MALNDKKLQRLDQLLAAFDTGAVQPDELIQAIDAVIAIIDQNGKTLVDKILENKSASDEDISALRSELAKTKTNLETVISNVKDSSSANVDQVRAALLTEIKRVESLIPELPPETDLSEVFGEIESQKELLANLSILIVGENIRNALESLQGDERLDVSAIKGIDKLIADIKLIGGEQKSFGVRLLKYLADVNIDGITNGQTLVWDSATGKFIPGTGSGGASTFIDLTDTPATYTGQAGKAVVVNITEDALEFVAPTGTGTVTSVAISGSDGIEVDSGSPITAAGTIALGLNKTTTLTFLNVEDGAEVNNISDVNATDLTDAGDSALHFHSADRNRTNHTGTQTASTISDFDTAVAANAAVAANTAKVTNATHTGDVTGATALTIAANAVSDAKFRQSAALTVVGRSANSTGNVADIAASVDGHVLRRSGTTLGFGTVATAGITDAAVTLAKMANLAQDQFIVRTTASTGVPQTATVTAAARTVLDDTTVGDMVNTLGGATSTGTGGLVRAGSPALTTPSIAAILVSGGTLTLPTGATDTLVSRNSTDTLTNKTLSDATNKLRFQKTISIESPTAAEDISFFFTNNAVTITEMRAVLVGSSTPSVTWTVRHGTDRSATGAEVVTGGTTTTSTTTGSDVVSFNDATIVADSHVWVESTAASGTVGNLIITVFYTED